MRPDLVQGAATAPRPRRAPARAPAPAHASSTSARASTAVRQRVLDRTEVGGDHGAPAGLLFNLADGGGDVVLPRLQLALGKRPVVLARPVHNGHGAVEAHHHAPGRAHLRRGVSLPGGVRRQCRPSRTRVQRRPQGSAQTRRSPTEGPCPPDQDPGDHHGQAQYTKCLGHHERSRQTCRRNRGRATAEPRRLLRVDRPAASGRQQHATEDGHEVDHLRPEVPDPVDQLREDHDQDDRSHSSRDGERDRCGPVVE